METMDLGSWFTQSSLYGDDHVLDDKSKYKYYALMITIWCLYVLKHTVERSTHMCSGVTPERGLWLHHAILLPFYPQIKDAFYIIVVTRYLCQLSRQTPLYPHTSYSIGNTYPKILVQYFINLCAFTTLPSINTGWCQAPHYMIDKALYIDKFIACIIDAIPKYDKP
jgi:hypothetical protein